MKNLIIIIIIMITSIASKGQKKPKIYYDNRDSSVVKIFGNTEVSLMLKENPRYGFSTVNFSISAEGKVVSIHNLLNADDLIFKTAKEAIYKSSGTWKIKPGMNEQTFQITFFVISDRLDSLRRKDNGQNDFRVLNDSYIKYYDSPKEVTILPTITIIYKEKLRPVVIVQ